MRPNYFFNNPDDLVNHLLTKFPEEPGIELYDQSLILWSAVQENGKVTYIPSPSKTYLDKDVAEKVAAQIKDVYEKLKFAKIYKKTRLHAPSFTQAHDYLRC